MIGKSRLHAMFNKGRILSESMAWYNTFNPATKRELIDLIRIEQLFKKGIDGTGEVIGYYSLSTSRMNPKKKFNTHYTFEDTGDFFRSFYIQVFIDAVVVNANTDKGDEDLMEKFSRKLLTLTNENFQILKETVKASYIKQLKSVLGIN